ncbi:hypothetical protein [Clostridioides difficile]|uniref:hypothetical protein n=1 Tax=Clostridioides difficile TaxID=1496 RepID=UPI001F24783F|nr:hypothetical protein [Clostridioides difficile]
MVFKNAGFLTYETTNKYIVITIENWELYQENIENQQPNQQTINNHQHNQEYKDEIILYIVKS